MSYPTTPTYGGAPPVANPQLPLRKPTSAFVLSLIGGIFILLWGLVIVAVGVSIQSQTFGLFGGDVVAIGGIEATLGLLCIVFGVLLYVSPQNHVVFGVLVLVFALVSLIGLGGLIIGFILALIGGILGIAHKPEPDVVVVSPYPVYYQPPPSAVPVQPGYGAAPPPQPYPYAAPSVPPAPQPAERYCPSCGAGNARSSAFCAKCGKALPPPA